MKFTFENSILTFCFLLFSIGSSYSQSKFEFGVGIGINHSDIVEDIKTQIGGQEGQQKGLRLPALMTRVGYKINDRFHINTGPGLSWMGAIERNHSSRMIASTFELPLQLEWNPKHSIHLSTGPIYNYILGISNQSDLMNIDMLPGVKSRHQIGLKHGVAFSYNLLELSLSYSHYLTDVFNIQLTDVNGNLFGTLVSRFKNIQLGILIRR